MKDGWMLYKHLSPLFGGREDEAERAEQTGENIKADPQSQ